jgi:hypothetical protein
VRAGAGLPHGSTPAAGTSTRSFAGRRDRRLGLLIPSATEAWAVPSQPGHDHGGRDVHAFGVADPDAAIVHELANRTVAAGPSTNSIIAPLAADPPGSSHSGAARPFSLIGMLPTTIVSPSRTYVALPVSVPRGQVPQRPGSSGRAGAGAAQDG